VSVGADGACRRQHGFFTAKMQRTQSFSNEHLKKSSPRMRGSSNSLILGSVDSRFRGNDGLVQTILNIIVKEFLGVLCVFAVKTVLMDG
jgi:hypothetical protein